MQNSDGTFSYQNNRTHRIDRKNSRKVVITVTNPMLWQEWCNMYYGGVYLPR